MDEKTNIFRKKSIERISSPEQLNDYICVSSPGVWLILMAMVVLLAGVVIWGVFGTMNSYIDVCAVSEKGKTTVYINEDSIDRVTEDMPVLINGTEYTFASIGDESVEAEKVMDEYDMHVGGIKSGEWVYPATLTQSLPTGTYSAKIIAESVNPVSFVFN